MKVSNVVRARKAQVWSHWNWKCLQAFLSHSALARHESSSAGKANIPRICKICQERPPSAQVLLYPLPCRTMFCGTRQWSLFLQTVLTTARRGPLLPCILQSHMFINFICFPQFTHSRECYSIKNSEVLPFIFYKDALWPYWAEELGDVDG